MYTSDLHMHWLALAFIFLTTIFLVLEIYDVMRWPKERHQWWNLVLLILLAFFNVTNGNFPNPGIAVGLKLQYMLMDGSAYLVGAYFPFYFYKIYRLDKLRFHALYAAPVFVFMPFLICEVGLYAHDNRLVADRQWGVLVPMVYGLVALGMIVRAIIHKFKEDGERSPFIEALSVWFAVTFWELMCAFPFVAIPQWVKLLIGNLGLMVVVAFLLVKHIRLSRAESAPEPEEPRVTGVEFTDKCLKMGFSLREIQVADLVCRGKKNKLIADELNISFRTVDNHLRNIYDKAGVRGKLALIAKLKQ